MTIDFSRMMDYVWALLPEIVLSVVGMVVLLMGVRRPAGDASEETSRPDRRLDTIALIGVVLAAAANFWLYQISEAGHSAMIAVDGFRLFGNWILLAGLGMGIAISPAYVFRQRLQAGEYYSLLLFATVGMMVMIAARDLMVIFLGLELMSMAVYALAAFNRRDRRSAEAGLKYFLLGAFSSGFLLYGVALAYGATGSTNIAVIATSVQSAAAQPVLILFAVAFLVIGFGFKVSAVPMHMWTPDVYEGSPAPVTAFMSVAVKAAAFLTFLRVFLVAFDGLYGDWFPVLWWLAVVTMVVANLIALTQKNVKRMLAYSSIAHAGYLLVALAAANETAAAGMLFYLLVYTFMNVGAFAVVIMVARQGEDRLHVGDYAGFGWSHPVLGVALTIFLLSLAGFPGTGGFIGKIQLLLGAVDAELWTLSVILVLTTVVSYYYYLQVAWFMWMRKAPTDDTHASVFAPPLMKGALMVSAAVILLTGVLPGAALDFARESVQGLMEAVRNVAALEP